MNIRRSHPLVLALATVASASLALAQPAQKSPQNPETQQSTQLPSLAPLVDSVRPAVVNVQVQAKGGAEGMNPFDFFGRGGPQQRLRQGEGSGCIIDPSGLVLTNNHVIEGAVNIIVKLDDAREFSATIVGRDPLTDVALLKLKGASSLPFVKLGSSDAMKVGDWTLAIGSPFGLASSVSLGILSAKARNIQAGPYDEFLQTDAAINPGNSGGPLFNMRGEVIGINTAIVGGGTGIGFAVPSDLIKVLLPQLQKEGVVTRGWLGVGIQDLSGAIAKGLGVPVNKGAVVVSVNEGSPAGKAGLKPDDVVTAIDGKEIASGSELTRVVALKRPGSTTTLTVFRGNKKQDIKVQLGTRPDLEGLGLEGRKEGGQEDKEARLGLGIRNLDPREAQQLQLPTQGALITSVAPGSPADRAELMVGMVVVEADKKPIKNAQELSKVLRGAKSGSTVLLRVATTGGGRLLRALLIP